MHNGLENNKIFASILIGSLVVLISGFITDIIYKPNNNSEVRGYEVATEEANQELTKVIEKIISIKELMANANSELGKKVFRKCVACHTINKGGKNKVGPNLWNIVGRKQSSNEGFKYSKSLTSKDGVWNYDNLYQFLNNPNKYSPGTKMSFVGLKKPEEIAGVIAYLEQYVGD